MLRLFLVCPLLILVASGCSRNSPPDQAPPEVTAVGDTIVEIQPAVVTQPVRHDTDDPAIWINPDDPAQSLIIGTDKDRDGALYVFDLAGNVLEDKVVRGLQRPNNVDVAYGLSLGGQRRDVAVTTERMTHRLRIFTLPDMQPVDGGGLPMFEGEDTAAEHRDLMGIALYRQPRTEEIYAIVGRKNGPTDGTYLWQYHLTDNGAGQVQAQLVRKFGAFSGQKEIEAIAVDHALGYVYYSDEGVGVRKYYADPDADTTQLALFATAGFADDHEGISIYQLDDKRGYILVSDQQANQFHIFPREGTADDPHHHPLLKMVRTATRASDGSDVVSVPLNDTFRHGLFVAMSEDRTFQYYRWEDLAGEELSRADTTTF